ncbi:MAG: PepSY-associated TM helix domain-containing protein [Prolixibacteraceae bacterium]
MKIRRLLRILHRDFGYFIAGMTIVYALSGIYLNHRHDFNPDYKIFTTVFQTNIRSANVSEDIIMKELGKLDRPFKFKKHFITNDGYIKIFIENGEAIINPGTGEGRMQYLQRRPVIFEMNKLHRATLGAVWKWVSDFMGAVLIFVAVSGLFILKGKRGFSRWGWWLTISGIVIPLLFVILYI